MGDKAPLFSKSKSRNSLLPSVAMAVVTRIDHKITPFMLGCGGSAEERKKPFVQGS